MAINAEKQTVKQKETGNRYTDKECREHWVRWGKGDVSLAKVFELFSEQTFEDPSPTHFAS